VLGCILSVGVAAAAGARFPASVYPPAVPSHGGALAVCPNPAGLERFGREARTGAVTAAADYDRISRSVDLHDSDRAWWPAVRGLSSSGKPAPYDAELIVTGSVAGPASAYAGVVAASCGSPLVKKSLTVTLAPRHRDGCDASVFFVDRRGHALIYWLS
jgi:hypothetical protein